MNTHTNTISIQPPPVLPDYRSIVIDETPGWDTNFLANHGIARVEAICLFDRNEHARSGNNFEAAFVGNRVTLNDEDHPEYEQRFEAAVEAVRDESNLNAEKFLSLHLTNVDADPNIRAFTKFDLEDLESVFMGEYLTSHEALEKAAEQYAANPTRD